MWRLQAISHAHAKSLQAANAEVIAERRGAEQGRHESEDRYRVIVETANEGIWTIDEKHLTTFVNRALAEMLGYEPQELLGKSVFDLLEPAAVGEAQRSLALRREGVSEQLERSFRAKDGHEVWTLISTSTLHDSDGEYAGALAMVTDISERRAAEVEHAHLAAIVHSSADSIISMATAGTIESWNEASSRLYGYSATEALGQPASSLLARDPSEREQLVARAAAGDDQQVENQDVGKDGGVIDVSVTLSGIHDSQGRVIGVSRIARDIGARKHMERELRYLAEHDWLTGLYNRRRLISELARSLAYARRYRRAGAVVVLDVDNFKLVNDTKGHDEGDRTLKSVAELLVRRTRDTDIVARLGGDEFAIVLPEATGPAALKFASDIRSLLCERAIGPPIYVSVGISLFATDHEITADDALVAADIAQYEAKQHGGDQVRIFDGRAAGTLTWVERIRTALAEDRFVLFGQPIVDLRSDLVTNHELLIRMLSEDGEIIAPGEFLPTAERFGLIGEIDHWVTQHGLRLAIDGERVTINLAGPSIGDERILGMLEEAIADGLNPGNVIFEITETAAVSSFERAELFAERLKGMGCDLALDDFGTGFGSFTYLKHLNARYLKIDLQFVRDLVTNETDQTVVKAIVDIAHSLEKKTIAEGVEDAATLTALKDRGVDFAQGFFLGRPERLSRPGGGTKGVAESKGAATSPEGRVTDRPGSQRSRG